MLHQDIFFLYMDMHIYYNILCVQHNHIVDIENLDKKIPLKINRINIFFLHEKELIYQRKSVHTEQNVGNLNIFGTN
jgi:hypothetical protein